MVERNEQAIYEHSVDPKKFYDIQYNQRKMSCGAIAKMLGTYPNKVRREMEKLGFEMRARSDAVKLALESGRLKHPTKGTVRPADVKKRISETQAAKWEMLPPRERLRRSEQAQAQWEAMPAATRKKLQSLACEGVRDAGKHGSKIEKFLYKALKECGYAVIFHKEGLIPNEKLQLDLYLPKLRTAIEIDGPAHFYPIWSQKNLEKHQKADSTKSGLLLSGGYCIIRIKNLIKNMSQKNQREILAAVLQVLEKIDKKFPPKDERYIEIEAK